VFRFATSLVHKILTGGSAPALVESFSQLPPLLRLGIPALGGLLAGAIIQFGTRLRGEVTTTDYMEAVVLGDGKIAARRTFRCRIINHRQTLAIVLPETSDRHHRKDGRDSRACGKHHSLSYRSRLPGVLISYHPLVGKDIDKALAPRTSALSYLHVYTNQVCGQVP
jgi:hypothetical protein